MKHLGLWRAGAATLALAAVGAPAVASHSWSTYHWNTTAKNAPFDVYVNVASHWRQTVDSSGTSRDLVADAVADWNDPAGASTAPHTKAHRDRAATYDGTPADDYLAPSQASGQGGSPALCDPIAGAIYVCSSAYGANGWLGLATIWAEGSHITQGTTKLNDTYHGSGTYASYSWRASVTCQEIGHDFGLGHQDENSRNDTSGSCMEYTSNPAGNETPDWHDFDQLQTIYQAHLNGTEGSGGGGGRPGRAGSGDPFAFRELGTPPSAAADNGERGWGRIVGYDSEGRPNRFEKHLDGDVHKITHVRWVPGFRPQAHHMDDHDH